LQQLHHFCPLSLAIMSFLFNSTANSSQAVANKSSSTLQDVNYSFDTEYLDVQANLIRRYQLTYFTADNTIELYDTKNRRVFLKRCAYPSIQLSDIYPGAQVTVYARQLKILDYADSFTRQTLAQTKGKSIAIIKSNAFNQAGNIINQILSAGFKVGRVRMIVLGEAEAQQFYGESRVNDRVLQLASGPILALEIIGQGVHEELEQLVAKAAGGLDSSSVHIAASERSAELELQFLFNNSSIASSALLNPNNCTIAVIKPHIIQQNLQGKVIQSILSSSEFSITALQSFNLDRQAAEEFLEIYKTIVPEYHALVEQLTAGSCIALEITRNHAEENGSSDGSNPTVNLFREFCGPSDPEIARQIRPNSLRALYGINKVKNAVHCTDLTEDGILEAEFFFEILQNNQQ
jgi:nucleoside-diphosphate kinase